MTAWGLKFLPGELAMDSSTHDILIALDGKTGRIMVESLSCQSHAVISLHKHF